jgi:hypothetical protein
MTTLARKLLPAMALILALAALASLALGQDATPEATPPVALATNTPDTPQEVPVPAVTPSVTEIATVGNVTAINIGDTANGELTVNAPSAIYSFAAKAGDIVAITMTSSDIDSYLQFGDAQGNPLAAADDGAGGLNARMGPYQIPTDGTYVIVAESFGFVLAIDKKVETGKFKLTVQKFDPQTITYPGNADGKLDVDTPLQTYKATLNAGDVIVARMRSEDIDSFLSLSEAARISGLVVRNDDFGSGSNSQIGPYIVPETGDYLLTATSFASNVQGSYKLSLDKLTAKPIAYGDKVDDEISDADPAIVYSFTGAAGDRINAVVAGEGDLDTMMTLLGPDGAQVAFNDEANGHNPALQGQALPSDGAYTLVVQPFAAGQTGKYHIEFDKAS